MYGSEDEAKKDLGTGDSFGKDELITQMTYLTGAGTPTATSTIPTRIGQFYFDSSNENWYLSVDTANVADFKQITN